MPEIPDVEVFSKNLDKFLAGRKLIKIKVVNGKKLPDTAKALSKNLEGKILKRIYRSGKEFRFEFEDGTLLGLHLMLTGDMFLFSENNDHHSTIVELHFEGNKNLALTDRMRNAYIKLNPVDKDGVDAMELDFKYLKKIFNRKTTIKNILLDQDLIRGIGNGYSDEILWEARISPYSIASAIPDEKIKELVKIIPAELKAAAKKIDKAYPGRINDEVKEFLKIHRKVNEKSPTGHPIHIDTKGSRKTYYTDEQVLYAER
ncbi:MAG TPA: DNA-formamidopyrimidine glycosylase family protein [Puia sp.]|jgi:formamidopyrimidine-DNA glycosylase|nr:DNA-formamidopyrimidine glycosylase family protein [Puia sp.]